MMLSLTLALIWLGMAQATGLLRPAPRQRAAAVALTILGIPMLGWITTEAGPYIGLALLAAGVVSLCWPLPGLRREARNNEEWREPAE
jgi:membrane protease YdiL (CAAX protease family)